MTAWMWPSLPMRMAFISGRMISPFLLARKLLGEEAIIGGSAGNMEEARKCLVEGADYIGFGPVYSYDLQGRRRASGRA